MKLVKPSVEIWEQCTTLKDMWKHIARCTRVCYQGTPKNDEETDEEFVKRVILRPDSSTGRLNFDKIHGAMLEHGTVYLTFPITNAIGDEVNLDITYISRRYRNNKYSKVVSSDKYVYITTNLRVIYENNWLDDLEYIDIPSFHYRRVTVSFITNIGVSREFNRHRVNSMAEESTRYCNYSLGKFDGEVTFVKPVWFDNMTDKQKEIYLESLVNAETNYLYLLELGWKPQQAREVLPLATKTQLIHTAFIDDWKHFFALRADGVSGPVHPNAKLLAMPLKQEFIKRQLI